MTLAGDARLEQIIEAYGDAFAPSFTATCSQVCAMGEYHLFCLCIRLLYLVLMSWACKWQRTPVFPAVLLYVSVIFFVRRRVAA